MRKLWEKKQYVVFCLILGLLVFMSVMSVMSLRLLQGNARVVNYVGIVRGATQKLIKEELMGWHLSRTDPGKTDDWYPDDALVARLDSIVTELLHGNGPNGLVVLQDKDYQENMRQVRQRWEELKKHIIRVRDGENPDTLFALSQEYFTLVDKTVSSAEAYSEAQVDNINFVLFLVNSVVLFLLIAGIILYIRSIAVKRRADELGEIAYVDPLTRLANRARCEQVLARYERLEKDTVVAVFVFDMNDLKLTNDFFGHQGGDRVIAAFARILCNATISNGFVGRFGGDEFLAIFDPGNEELAETFLSEIHEQTEAYNAKRENTLEMLRYAVGYVIANARERNIEDIIHEADNRMYENKRILKKLK